MRVACFCGETFESTDDIAACPACGEPVELPKLEQEESEQCA